MKLFDSLIAFLILGIVASGIFSLLNAATVLFTKRLREIGGAFIVP